MGKARRCRSVVLGASVAVLGTVSACPPTNAASTEATGSHAPRATIARRHAEHHQRHAAAPIPAAHPGKYVYEVSAEGEVNVEHPNTSCSGTTLKLAGMALSAEGPGPRNSNQLWQQNPAAWERPYTVTTGATTTITMDWLPPKLQQEAVDEGDRNNGEVRNPRFKGQEDSTTASRICAATAPGAAVASIGRAQVVWSLAAPVRNLATLLADSPTSIHVEEDSAVFEVLPDGTVPSFTPYNS
jgi:hypothetical protein